MSGPRVAAVLVAGGSGERFGRHGGKQLAEVAGRPVAWWALSALAAAPSVESAVVVCHPDRVDEYREALSSAAGGVPVSFVAGGATRQESVAAGVAAASALGALVVVVHDGARPLVTPDVVERALAVLAADDALAGVVVGHPVTDTLKLASDGFVETTPDRSRYWAAQTPQVFRAETLRAALAAAAGEGLVGTDDAMLVERLGGRVALVEGPRDNLKITAAEDLAIAEALLLMRGEGRG